MLDFVALFTLWQQHLRIELHNGRAHLLKCFQWQLPVLMPVLNQHVGGPFVCKVLHVYSKIRVLIENLKICTLEQTHHQRVNGACPYYVLSSGVFQAIRQGLLTCNFGRLCVG